MTDPDLNFPWIKCGICGEWRNFMHGTLVVKDGDKLIEIVGECCAESYLRELLDKGKGEN